jgi:hypothetical protein
MKKYFYYFLAYVGADSTYISLRFLLVKMEYFALFRRAKWTNICCL